MKQLLTGFRSWIAKSVTFEQAVRLWTTGSELGNTISTNEAYRQSVWVNSAIKNVTGPLKSISLRFFANNEEYNNPALESWWREPAVNLSQPEFVEASGGWQKLSGESFWILDDTWFESRASKSKVILARPMDMRHIVQSGKLVGWVYTDASGKQHNLLPEEVVHIKQWNPYSHWRGLGELDAARVAVETDYAAGNYARDTFRNAGDAGAYVTSKNGVPSEAQQQQIVAALRDKRAARMRGDYRPVFLAGDIEVTDPKVQAPDAGFTSNRLLSRHEIFIAFGVPASMSDVIASYSIGSASDMFRLIQNTCIPLGNVIASGVDRLLALQMGNTPTVRAYFDWDEHPTMQAVRRERVESAVKLFQMGMPLKAASEYLDMDLPEFDGWDQSYLPLNLVSNGEDSTSEAQQDNTSMEPAEDGDLSRAVIDIADALKQRSIAGKEIDLRPTAAMAQAAAQGLEWRKEYNRGGTSVGVARARDIVNRKNLSPDTIGRMVSYFARHEVDKEAEGFREGEEGFPSAGKIAWQLWGGDAGKAWSRKKWDQIKDEDEEKSLQLRETTSPRSEQRTALWRKLVQGRSTIEKMYLGKFTRLLADARREQIAKINANASLFGQSNKVLAPQLVFSLDPWKNKLKKAFRQVNVTALNESVREVNEEIERVKPSAPATPNAPKADPWKLPPQKAVSFLDSRENLISGIADDIHKEIMGLIEQGMRDQLGSDGIAEKIREKFNQISNGRAKTIARTETGAAYGYSREEALVAAGIQYKEWLATQDDRCRATHLAADGQIVPIDQPFEVGGASLMYPCDPDGPPDEIINCRCVQVAVDRP